MAKKTNTTAQELVLNNNMVAVDQTNEDFKTALLLVSLAVNAFIFIGWVLLKVTSDFDYQVAMFLFLR